MELLGKKLDKGDLVDMEDELMKMIGQLDTNTDGVISEEELVKGCMEDEDLFEALCCYSGLLNEIIKSDLDKLEWKQEMEEFEEEMNKMKSELEVFT